MIDVSGNKEKLIPNHTDHTIDYVEENLAAMVDAL
jgi:hypothetical protein